MDLDLFVAEQGLKEDAHSLLTRTSKELEHISTSVCFDVCSLLIMPKKYFLETTSVGRGLHHADFTESGSRGAPRLWGV